jgi:non-ribosomal peptide synthetase component F
MGQTAVEKLFYHLEHRREAPSFSLGGETLAFGELDEKGRRYAAGLVELGVEKGDRVVSILESSLELVQVLVGHHRLGAIHVPVNTRYRRKEIEHIINDAAPRVVVVGAKMAAIQTASIRWRRSGLIRLMRLQRPMAHATAFTIGSRAPLMATATAPPQRPATLRRPLTASGRPLHTYTTARCRTSRHCCDLTSDQHSGVTSRLANMTRQLLAGGMSVARKTKLALRRHRTSEQFTTRR